MGYNGNGKKHQPFEIPWKHWNDTIHNDMRTASSFYLFPREVRGYLGHGLNATDKEIEREPITLEENPDYRLVVHYDLSPWAVLFSLVLFCCRRRKDKGLT